MFERFAGLPKTRREWWLRVAVIPLAAAVVGAGGFVFRVFRPGMFNDRDAVIIIGVGLVAALLAAVANFGMIFDHRLAAWPKVLGAGTACFLVAITPAAGFAGGLAVENGVHDARGAITDCRIDSVQDRVEYSGGGSGTRPSGGGEDHYYEYALTCDTAMVDSVTDDTDTLGDKGDRVTVQYDTARHLKPFVTGSQDPWDWWLLAWLAAGLLVAGTASHAALLWKHRG